MTNKKKSLLGRVVYIVTVIILCVLVYYAYQYYQSNNFNDFIRSEANLYTSEFKRDDNIKYNDKRSYSINSDEYNDAMFYEEVNVEKNQPYKVTCMVKTENVKAKDGNSGVGAQISIEGSTERSVAIQGNSDWQRIELIFNSKDRDTINIGFRLGGNLGEAKGKAWFSDFTLEEGVTENNNDWDFACFIFKTTNVNINNNQINLEVTDSDIRDIENTISRFENSCYTLSKGKMTANCDIYELDTPLSKLSYDEEFGYYVAPEDVENQIKDIISNNNYDHIFVVVRLGDEEHENDIQVNDWIGLGSMDYYGIGFSNIRLPNDSRSYVYKYNTRINQFPEEVFLHEFLHTLERNAQEYGYERPELHAYESYGYENEAVIGQREWYRDYMNKEIQTSSENVGLPPEIYSLKPAKRSNFESSYEVEAFKEPENILEEIKQIIDRLFSEI